MSSSGNLRVEIVSASNLTNMDGLFGKNDAYAIIKVGAQTQKSNTIDNAGKEAVWNESFNFSAGPSDEVAIEVFDSDKLQDDMIGQVKIPLDFIFQQKQVEKRYPLSRGANNSGDILLRFHLSD